MNQICISDKHYRDLLSWDKIIARHVSERPPNGKYGVMEPAMSYETNEISGYVMNIREFLKDFPELMKELSAMYPPKDSQSWDWVNPSDSIMNRLQEFVHSEIHDELTVSVTGSWYGDFVSLCPFEPNEAYAVFAREELIDENRKSGKSVARDSELFARLKTFMKRHGISEDALTYEEWKCGG